MNETCSRISALSLQQQKEMVVTFLWSMRITVKKMKENDHRIPDSEKLNLSLERQITFWNRPICGTGDPAVLKQVKDCVNLTVDQSDENAMIVFKSFAQAKREGCGHIACVLYKAVSPEGIALFLDGENVRVGSHSFMLSKPPGFSENPFARFVEHGQKSVQRAVMMY